VGLVNAGALSFRQSLGVVFGANVGTTVTAQLVAFEVTDFAPVLILLGFAAGYVPFRFRVLGRSIFYVGVVFFSLDLVATAPSVAYRVTMLEGEVRELRSPQDLPEPTDRRSIAEPYVKAMILTPSEYVGPIMELATARRGIVGNMNYLSPERVELDFEIPLGEIVFDFFDLLKSKTKGYASLDYEPAGYKEADLVKVDILLNALPVDAFSAIVHRDNAQDYGKKMTSRLRELIPRQLFDVPIQAAIGGRIISRETVKAKRKDVTAKCYGGDISRKKKLLQRQKEGKKRMKMVGSVEVPQEAFVAALKVDDES